MFERRLKDGCNGEMASAVSFKNLGVFHQGQVLYVLNVVQESSYTIAQRINLRIISMVKVTGYRILTNRKGEIQA